MPQFHLGVLETGGFDLGAIAFIGYVIAQLFAMIVFRQHESKSRNDQDTRPSVAEIGAVDSDFSSLAKTTPQICDQDRKPAYAAPV